VARPRKSLEQHALTGTTPEWTAGQGIAYRAGRPRMPKDYSPEEKTKWLELVRLLSKRGTITPGDGPALELYVAQWSRWRALLKHIKDHGAMFTQTFVTKNGETYEREVANPALKLAAQLETGLRLLMKEFSTTPASRQRTTPTVAEVPKVPEGHDANPILL